MAVRVASFPAFGSPGQRADEHELGVPKRRRDQLLQELQALGEGATFADMWSCHIVSGTPKTVSSLRNHGACSAKCFF